MHCPFVGDILEQFLRKEVMNAHQLIILINVDLIHV
jgi:hypothetical protein